MKVIHFEKLDSTNKYLKENYTSLDDFCVVSCDFQTNGKGRNNRKWFSREKENLLFSILVKNENLIKDFHKISIISACTIRKYLERIGIKNTSVKWPNDVYVGDKKIAGILLEGNLPNYLAIGIGLNVNQIEFDEEYRVAPTSMALENRKKYIVKDVLVWILDDLIENLMNLKSPIDDFRGHNYLINKEVNFEIDNQKICGKVLDINDDFSLKIQTNKGIKNIFSNEINVL